jgi:hypothetical protein
MGGTFLKVWKLGSAASGAPARVTDMCLSSALGVAEGVGWRQGRGSRG